MLAVNFERVLCTEPTYKLQALPFCKAAHNIRKFNNMKQGVWCAILMFEEFQGTKAMVNVCAVALSIKLQYAISLNIRHLLL